MKYQYVPYLWLSLIMIIMMIALIGFAWKRRSVRGAPYFLLTLILVTIWIAAQALEIASVDLTTKIRWANIQYIPSSLVSMTYFYLTLQFVGRDRWLKLRWLPILLSIMPIILNILLWTNDLHGLMRQNVYLDWSGSFPVVGKTYGPFFWVFTVYNFSLTIVTLLMLAKGLSQKTRLYRAQIIALFMGLLLPACSVGLYITRIIPSRIDTTPLIIGVSGLIISWGILRYRLFDIVSIAHSVIIQEMSTGIILFDNEGGVLEINPAAKEMLDITLQQPVGLKVNTLFDSLPKLTQIYEEKIDQTDEVVVEKNVVKKYYEVSIKRLPNSGQKPLGWILQIYDITKRKLEEERMRQIASHDVLTGLLNRVYFKQLFLEQLAYAKMTGSAMAVAYLDLDDFKRINDTYGHDAGDVLLREVADRLLGVLRESDIIARYGGDEYAILFPSIGDNEKLEIISRKIFKAFEKYIEYNHIFIQIKASIGFSIYPRDGDNPDTLIKKADEEMYVMKRVKNYDQFNLKQS